MKIRRYETNFRRKDTRKFYKEVKGERMRFKWITIVIENGDESLVTFIE